MSAEVHGTVQAGGISYVVQYRLNGTSGTLTGNRATMYEMVIRSGDVVVLRPDSGASILITLASGKILSHHSGGRIAFLVNNSTD